MPHNVFLKKLENLGVGGCFLRLLETYLKDRTHFVRLGNIRSATINIPSGVRGIHHRTPSVLHFFDRPSQIVQNSYILLFADDLQFITTTTAHVKKFLGPKTKSIEKCNKENGMNFALNKNGFLQFRGDKSTFVLNHEFIESGEVMPDLEVYVRYDLTWSTHREEK